MKEMESLNARQREAVEATEGRIRVVAGAGSGKTKALTCRYAYLVNMLGVDPANILCLTFTNKAAQEMRQRIHRMVAGGDYNDFVCTIHGFCVKFLRQEIHRLGYPKSFTILDEEDQKQLAKQVMEEFHLNRTVETVRQFLDGVGNRKVALFIQQPNYIDQMLLTEGLNSVPVPADTVSTSDDHEAFTRYLALQQKTLALDFQDLIFFTIHILKRFPDACRYWQNEMQYIMLDEAQDCNKSDWTIVETLQGIHHNLFIVGDPDQCIYEWRGARPKMFIDFPNDRTIILDQNYRSTSPILSVANSVISRNRNRVPKELFTTRTGGTKVTHFHAKSDQEEARWIANKIKEICPPRSPQGGTTQPGESSVAILYRASYLSRILEQALVNAGIEYVIWGGVRFFDRTEIKDALAYLRLIDKVDDLSFLRICNVPSRKVGKVYLERLRTFADRDNTTLYEALKHHISARELYKETMVHFIDLIEECRQFVEQRMQLPIYLDEHGNVVSTQRRDHVISDVLDLVLERSGYKQLLREDDDTDRLENLTELLQGVHTYEEAHLQDDALSISGYLQEIALYTNLDRTPPQSPRGGKTKDTVAGGNAGTNADEDTVYNKDSFSKTSPLGGTEGGSPRAGSVKLMTIHQSKGLEFPYVFVYGLSEGIFPSLKTLLERKGEGEEEERRLMYVAVTRAEKELFLTESEGFNAAAKMSKYPSRFLCEIKRDLFVTEGEMDEMLWTNLATQLPPTPQGGRPDGAPPPPFGGTEGGLAPLLPGTRVRHAVLGPGTIVAYNAERQSYTVDFASGTRSIRGSFLSIDS